jgi:hypothetical protein
MTHSRISTLARRLARGLALVVAVATPPAALIAQAPPAPVDTPRSPNAGPTQSVTNPAASAPATATQAAAPTTPGPAASPVVDSLLTVEARMGDRIRLRTRGVDEWAKTSTNDPKKLVLYLDGRAMQGAVAQRVSGAGMREQWEIRLRRSEEARDAWEAVLGKPIGHPRNVRVGLGPGAGPEFAITDSVAPLGLALAPRGWLWLPILAWLVAIVGLIYLARNTAIIRDSPAPVPPPPGDTPPPAIPQQAAPKTRAAVRAERKQRLALRPYSMARWQMAFWFVLVTTAFLGIWIITGDTHGVITTQALFLIGLGAGTALAARVVEANGRQEQADAKASVAALDAQWQTLNATKSAPISGANVASNNALAATNSALEDDMRQLEALRTAAAPDAPMSKGFFTDILTEMGEPALHRYQYFVWTLIVGAVFLVGAYETLALPNLDDTMLLLMGISAATYVGFKTREQQT